MTNVSEVHVDDYLEKRIRKTGFPKETATVIYMIILSYNQAMSNHQWATARAFRELLIEVAHEFRNEQDFPVSFSEM